MSNDHSHGTSVATYVIVALVLGVITYIEFAIVEYEIAWLSAFWTLFWLVLLSVAKFLLVVMFFMHLKDDDNIYTGFFGSGMIFALGTFVVLALLFTLPATFRFFRAQTGGATADEATAAHGDPHAEDHGLPDEVRALIESDGYSRPVGSILDTPRPKNLRVTLALPEAGEARFLLPESSAPFGLAISDDEAAAGDEADVEVEIPAPEEGDAEATAQEDAEEEPADAEAEDAQAEDATQEDAEEEPADAEAEDAEAQGEAEADQPAAEAAPSWDEELGQQAYSGSCASCHQGNGQGIPGAFPPLAGHMPDLYNADGGREYLVDVILYGLVGQIEVNGQSYDGQMPAWPQLSDEQIAAVLNHELTAWDNRAELDSFDPITAAEVEERRGRGLSAADVYEQRQALALP